MNCEEKIIELNLLKQKSRIVNEKSYYEFFRDSYKLLNPNEELVDNWHIKYLCDKLQEQIERINRKEPRKKHLVINIPPRSLKSHIMTICLPPWAWIHNASIKFVNCSYSSDLSMEHNVRCRNIITSEWYQENWSDKFAISDEQFQKKKFENSKFGYKMATSTGGSFTGMGGNIIVIDDILDPKRAYSEIERNKANLWFRDTLSTRLNNIQNDMFIIVMQRLHEDDLTGNILNDDKLNKEYELISIPAEETADIYPKELKKFYVDGLFFPKRFDRRFLDNQKAESQYKYAGQYLQVPVSAEGGILKKINMKYYNKVPNRFDTIIDSWDMTFKDLDTSDYIVGTVWGIKGSLVYLLHRTKEKCGFSDSINHILNHRKLYPKIEKTLIEDKANGTPIIEVLQKKIFGITAFQPKGSKIERLFSVQPMFESGNVLLPVKDIATFDVEDYIYNLITFPRAKNDDDVDSTTMALIDIRQNKSLDIDELQDVVDLSDDATGIVDV